MVTKDTSVEIQELLHRVHNSALSNTEAPLVSTECLSYFSCSFIGNPHLNISSFEVFYLESEYAPGYIHLIMSCLI